MPMESRDIILGKLKQARRKSVEKRIELPPLRELSLDRDQMLARFSEQLWMQTGVMHRVAGGAAAREQLTAVAREENLTKVIAATDDVLRPLELVSWGKEAGVEVRVAADFADRDAFKDYVFTEAQAGITGADFAIAETGTLGLVHDKDQPRLVSLAPILHIALVPVDRFVRVYEEAVERVYGDSGKMPSQFSFITGPSMTADIQATPFRGMHGPRRLIVIVIG
ncbi:MAG: lactate utilization protein C [Deltaproteobacteria bacterium]|nr:lactate utilization protein C [Deltaproteobacteria bacterium]